MCNATKGKSRGSEQSRGRVMFSIESFSGHNGVPDFMSQMITGSVVILVLVSIEMSLRQVFSAIKDIHPVLENETNRQILARHIGIDAFSCFTVAFLGLKARHVVQDLADATIGGERNAMPVAYEGRMFTYYPEAQRITLFFVAFQLKNTYDTLVWNDGALFVAHHILTLLTTWGAIQGFGHFYIVFYFGISEISTGVLCLLANFDDEHGAVGLADAFPMIKIVIGGLFATLFVICRVFMWSTFSYYYCRDAWKVIKGSDPRAEGHKLWWCYTFVSLSLLSILQIIWLGEIVKIGKEELEKLGML